MSKAPQFHCQNLIGVHFISPSSLPCPSVLSPLSCSVLINPVQFILYRGLRKRSSRGPLSHFPTQELQGLHLALKYPMLLTCKLSPGSPRNQRKLSASLTSVIHPASQTQAVLVEWTPSFKQFFILIPSICLVLVLNGLSNWFDSSLPRVCLASLLLALPMLSKHSQCSFSIFKLCIYFCIGVLPVCMSV